jgi:hypothetical protein
MPNYNYVDRSKPWGASLILSHKHVL